MLLLISVIVISIVNIILNIIYTLTANYFLIFSSLSFISIILASCGLIRLNPQNDNDNEFHNAFNNKKWNDIYNIFVTILGTLWFIFTIYICIIEKSIILNSIHLLINVISGFSLVLLWFSIFCLFANF
jgi:hypothetical protein